MGPERVPLLIIDDAHYDAGALRDQAIAASYLPPGDDVYPGLRAPAPGEYTSWLAETVGQVATRGLEVAVLRSTFAVVTQEPAASLPIQRIPHFDTTDPNVIAAIHYLCGPPHGGTSFYRHRRTGYQRIDAARRPAWQQAMMRDRRDFGMPEPRFPGESDRLFERVTEAALCFNRLILYPANCLHSGNLGAGGPEGGKGKRFTITSLVRSTKTFQRLGD